MKAKEYYDKYGAALMDEFMNPDEYDTLSGPTAKVYIAFCSEMNELIQKRNIKFDRAVPSLIDEMNSKWNALYSIFMKEHKVSPIKKDGFKTAIADQLKEG